MLFSVWSNHEKFSALATLTAAKLSGHRINIATEATAPNQGCSIHVGEQYMKLLWLTNIS